MVFFLENVILTWNNVLIIINDSPGFRPHPGLASPYKSGKFYGNAMQMSERIPVCRWTHN